MHEQHKIEHELKQEADRLASKYKVPILIIAAGGDSVPRTMTASCFPGAGTTPRLRDLLGILQASIQIESLKHFGKLSGS